MRYGVAVKTNTAQPTYLMDEQDNKLVKVEAVLILYVSTVFHKR
jgi:hypothetical protein